MPDHDPNARAEILKLLQLRLGNEIGYDDFRIAVEEIYNFRLDHGSVTEQELEVFKRLFNAVARYSPFPQDRTTYPTVYKDEKQIDEAVNQARQDLGIQVGPH